MCPGYKGINLYHRLKFYRNNLETPAISQMSIKTITYATKFLELEIIFATLVLRELGQMCGKHLLSACGFSWFSLPSCSPSAGCSEEEHDD